MNIAEHKLALEKLAKIKPGDVVAIRDFSRSWMEVDKVFPQRIQLMQVERLTPKQCVTTNNRRFALDSGRMIGENTIQRAFVPSAEEIAEAQETMQIRRVATWFDGLKLKNLNAEQLRAMKYAYDAVTPAAPTEGTPA